MAFPVVQFITVGRLSTFSCPFKFSDSPTERSSQFPNQLSIPSSFRSLTTDHFCSRSILFFPHITPEPAF